MRQEQTRDLLRRAMVGRGRFTVVREPGVGLSVSLWPYSQVLHAFAISDQVAGPSRFPALARGVQAYRSPRGGYWESIGRGQRYYDDNAWVGLAFLQRHLISGGSFSRQRAADLDDFVRGGLDACGGIRWVEGGQTLNACSTGAGALLHARLGGDISASLDFLSRLRNADGLVRDHVMADGSIEPSVWSYNQGLLIAAATTAGRMDLARDAAEAGRAYFTPDRLWEQPVAFNAVYAKALARLGPDPQLAQYADRLFESGRDEQGWFTRAGRYDEGKVLDAAAALQIFAILDFPQLVAKVV
jgi:Glycosyl hydrolase family 76